MCSFVIVIKMDDIKANLVVNTIIISIELREMISTEIESQHHAFSSLLEMINYTK